MKYSMLNSRLSIICVLVTGIHVTPAMADWYSNDPQLNRNQGFGDFPPATIEQDLDRQKFEMQSSTIESEPEQYRDTNLWDSGAAPVDHTPRDYSGSMPQLNNQPSVSTGVREQRTNSSPLGNIYAPVPAPAYGAYQGGVASPYNMHGPGYSGPWNNRASGFQTPWNNGGTGFSPWGGRGGPGNGSGPFGMSGPGGWFD